MAGIGPIRQDWEPVVVRKKAPTAAAKKDEKAVNAARRSGAEIETMKKYNAGSNKAASSGTSLNTKRLDEDTENLAHERVSSDLKKNIMQARLDKKLTQAQLAQMINEKPQVIQEYESGKAIPNQQIIGKLERTWEQSCAMLKSNLTTCYIELKTRRPVCVSSMLGFMDTLFLFVHE